MSPFRTISNQTEIKGDKVSRVSGMEVKNAKNARGFSANVSFDGKGVVRLIEVDQDLHRIADRRPDE